MSNYKIDKIEGIGPKFAEKLIKAGVTHTAHLLEKGGSAKGRKTLATDSGIEEAKILQWVNMADLMRIKGVGEEFSELLEAAGVDTVKELRTRKADNLTAKMVEVNAAKKLCKRNPAAKEVTRWIDHAKTLDAAVSH